MHADNTAHLRDAARRRHEQARSRTLQALDSLREENAHDRIKELTNDNTQFRKQLAHVHCELRGEAIASKTLPPTRNA
jgi:hypothetical protein